MLPCAFLSASALAQDLTRADAVAPADQSAVAASNSPEFRAAAPPRLEPGSIAVGPGEDECHPGEIYEWTSEQGLRYTWSLPPSYEKGKGYDLTVLCHGTGLDYRWGHANHDPHTFRTNSIIISPDGTSEGPDGSRLFLGEPDDAIIFRDFLLEMSRVFPARGIFLYGHSQGGFFVAYFIGEWPAAAEGVVAHASGAWSWSDREGGVQGVPIVFMHGTDDPVVPYRQSPAARDAYAEAGHNMVMLRRLPGYNHWPNPVRAEEALDYCTAMRTQDAEEALAIADSLLEPKPKDQFGYEAPPPFALAARICRRVLASHAQEGLAYGVPDFENPAADDHAARAQALLDEMNAHAELHVAALRADVDSRADIVLDGSPWLGHMLAVREDLRGLDPVETYVKQIAFDLARDDHLQSSADLYQAWYGENVTDKDKFEAVARALPHCFLADGLPSDLLEGMRTLHERADELHLSDAALENFELLELRHNALEAGAAAYEALWRTWRNPALASAEPAPGEDAALPDGADALDQADPSLSADAANDVPSVAPVAEELQHAAGPLSSALLWGIGGGALGVLIGAGYAIMRHRRRARAQTE